MINYPNGKPAYSAPNEVSYSRRGMTLEEDLNHANRYYLDSDRAAIYKKPTPITIVNVDYKSRQTARITEAYFQVPSTTDYNGIYRGRYLDFEAKETRSRTSFPLSSIHPHQLDHLRRVIRYGGIAFLIVRFVILDETWLVPAGRFLAHLETLKAKSVKHEWFAENCYLLPFSYTVRIDYLKVIDQLIDGGII